jgi:hypothetical protein
MSNTMNAFTTYHSLLKEWHSVVARDIPLDQKQAECMLILHDRIDQMAWSRIRGENRPLRFYADMSALQKFLEPRTGIHDDFGRAAIYPGWRLVKNWLDSHVMR